MTSDCRHPGPRAAETHKLWHRRGYLPHFDQGAVVQSVTFRLADSLPRHVFAAEKLAVRDDLAFRFRLEALFDRGCGSCLLKHAAQARIVETALKHFDGVRYRLIAWVIMPNHVHAVIEQMQGYRLGGVVHSWKSFTARQMNRQMGTSGKVWADDYFDRFIRNESHFASAVGYVENNPVKAGLVGRAADWAFSSAAAGDISPPCAQDARGPG